MLERIEDLEAAIKISENVVEKLHPNNPYLPRFLGNLANKLAYRHTQMGRMEDLEAAISNDERALKKAVNKTPQGHVDLLFNLDNLGVVLENGMIG